MRIPGHTPRRLALLAVIAALPAALPAEAAALPKSVHVTTPKDGADVSGAVHFKAATEGHPARVAFYVDGKRQATDGRSPFRLGRRLDTRALANGDHRLMVRAVWRSGRVRKDSIVIHVHNTATTQEEPGTRPATDTTSRPPGTSTTSPVTSGATGATWSDGFESGDFRGWSWWGQGQANLWGHIAVIDPRTQGVPYAVGRRVGRFETTAADIAAGRLHAKLFKFFTVGTGTSRRSPSNVSGTYRALYYIPTNYKVTGENWVNVFQFKEEYKRPGQINGQDPLWWLQFASGGFWRTRGGPAVSRPDAPVIFMNRWNNPWTRRPNIMAVPLGRWFEIRAELRQGQKIDWYVDGKLLDTALASSYPVSPFHGSGSVQWIFGIGNYSTSANGAMYADDASYRAR